MARIKYNSVHR